MSVQSEFNKYSKSYSSHRIVQDLACQKIYELLPLDKYHSILELGCGSGQFFSLFKKQFEQYYAIDFSSEMCDLHPRSSNLEVLCMDFDSVNFEQFLQSKRHFDLIIAPSSLQWSQDFQKIMYLCSVYGSNFACSIFTSKTFDTLHHIANKCSPLRDAQYYQCIAKQYFPDLQAELKSYTIKFKTKKEMFDYIKKSGVSGADTKLNYKDAKHLYKYYPLDYLEFEVIFITSFSI